VLGAIAIRARAIVEHWVHQHLEREFDLVAVVRPLRHRRREMSTGAGSADGDAIRVDPWLARQPQQRCITVFEWRRIGVFGSASMFPP
jgi:hypothetical protein